MPQELNLNSYPYFDDFDATQNYFKVLFKPGYPVQARELTTLQSILQNQIEQFGSYVFKEGSPVIGGNVNYNNNLSAVLLEPTYNNVDVGAYLPEIIGRTIKGSSSGVKAKIITYISPTLSIKNTYTIYVNFIDADTETNSLQNFLDGETLLIDEEVPTSFDSYFYFEKGQEIANTISESCNAVGSSVNVSKGIYFIRGYFVPVLEELIILDQYSNTPNYNIGFRIKEDIFNSDEDSSLLDNSQGFSNYSAPGADRLNISASLTAIPLDFNDNKDFVQIATVQNGVYTSIIDSPQLNELQKEFAKRTYDDSGDYYVKSPFITAEETLNDFQGNNGVFTSEQLTYNNNTPSEELGCYKISPFEAYVQGYNVKTISPVYIDFEKPRTTKTLNSQSINYYTGPSFIVNRVYGAPSLGISTTYTVSFRNERVGTNQNTPAGKEIGLARVYDFSLESGSYNTNNLDANEWGISLFDIQTYTELSLNQNLTSLSVPVYIEGKTSGATGYLKYSVTNSGIITAYNTRGEFTKGEQLIFNGINDTRIAVAVTSYGLSNVKSLYGIVGSASTFTADVKQTLSQQVNQVTITPESSGISTVTSANTTFVGITSVGDIVSFTNPGFSTSTYAVINNVTTNSLTISGVTTVSGVCVGNLPTTQINPTDFKILTSSLADSTDNTLYTTLGKEYISSVDFSDSDLTIRKTFDVTISNNSITVSPIPSTVNETFLPFSITRYSLILSNGKTEPLSSDQFVFSSGGSNLTINGISVASGTAKLIATLRKVNITAKTKNRNRIKTIIVDKSVYEGSGIGNTTFNDGLIYGNYPYGTRVQDKEICLLYPDVTKLYGIFESNQTSNPSLPNLIFSSLTGPTNTVSDLLIGEKITGKTSGTVAIYVESTSNISLNFVLLNSNNFAIGETVVFEESGVEAIVSNVSLGSNNITSNYTFENGQTNTFYDYSKIIRKPNISEPTGKLKIVFEYADIPSSDTGDLIVANTYNQFDYCDIPKINGISNTDILDIRPRVTPYTVTESTTSPFEFSSRSFNNNQSSSVILASDESILLNYSFYLPRIDKIFVNKDGIFQLSKGAPAENPQLPEYISDSLEIATITLPPYLCKISDANIVFTNHKRYQMSDIKLLENRIQNLESYTTLSALENNTSNMMFFDSNGLNRYKCGFFVDNFTSTLYQNKKTIVKNSVDVNNQEIRPAPYTTEIDLVLGSNSIIGIGTSVNQQVDYKYANDLIGSNIKRTGDYITLDYDEVEQLSQPYSSQIVNVNPFNSFYYSGTISLFPSSDTWVDQVQSSTPTSINIEGNYNETLNQLVAQGYDPQTGFGPVTWNSWETNWTGQSVAETTRLVTSGRELFSQVIQTTTKTGTQTKTGSQKVAVQTFDTQKIGNSVLSSNVVPFMRSRNIEFTAQRIKPYTQMYAFFSGVNVNSYIIPKLIEIQMISGTFLPGETVYSTDTGINNQLKIIFRLAKHNHKDGDYLNPTSVYSFNPYNRDQILSPEYTFNSTLLNVDTYSLSNLAQGQFYGNIVTGMNLIGTTSNAQAIITNVRLIADEKGYLKGSFYIPNPNIPNNPSFATGTQTFTLTSNSTNSRVPGQVISSAYERYYASGIINTTQENLLFVRNASIETRDITDFREVTQLEEPVVISSTREYNGYAGGVSQYRGENNARGDSRPQTMLGTAGYGRAKADGYTDASIRRWVVANTTPVDTYVAKKLDLPSSYINERLFR